MAHSKLRRTSGPRKAVLRSLVTALFQYGRIQTTEAKAKELRKTADKMISLAKRGNLMLVVKLKVLLWTRQLLRNCSMKLHKSIPNVMAVILVS